MKATLYVTGRNQRVSRSTEQIPPRPCESAISSGERHPTNTHNSLTQNHQFPSLTASQIISAQTSPGKQSLLIHVRSIIVRRPCKPLSKYHYYFRYHRSCRDRPFQKKSQHRSRTHSRAGSQHLKCRHCSLGMWTEKEERQSTSSWPSASWW